MTSNLSASSSDDPFLNAGKKQAADSCLAYHLKVNNFISLSSCIIRTKPAVYTDMPRKGFTNLINL